MIASDTFEQVLKAAQAAGSMTPAWKKFVKTKFFVSILRSPDDDPKNFLLDITRNPADGKPVVFISEVRDRLDQHHGDGVVAVPGADIVSRLNDEAGILVELADGIFSISRKRIRWLLSGIDAARARMATRKILLDAAPAAPLPVLTLGPPAKLADGGVPVQRLRDMVRLDPSKAVPRIVPQPPPRAAQPQAPPAEPVGRLRTLASSVPAMLSVIGVGIVLAIALLMSDLGSPVAPLAPASAPAAVRAPVAASAAGAAPPQAGLVAAAPGMLFAPADYSFNVTVPGAPEELELTPDQVDQTGEIRMHQYRLVVDDRVYTMQATDYGTRLPLDLPAAMDGMQAALVGKDGVLVQARPVALHGATGREVRVRLPNGALRAARFAFSGTRFCMVAVVAANGEQSAPHVDAFLGSFQLK